MQDPPGPCQCTPFRHRRSQSEANVDHFTENLGTEDDTISTYININTAEDNNAMPRHRHSGSVDSSFAFVESVEAKKAMPPEKLAELWTVDPKKAKRIFANRQSAARSKERKARYITELEKKVSTLQTEASTLSAQATMFQRETTGLSNENTELKFRLQAMEHQAQLQDVLNEALKQEVERIKFATGEVSSQSDTFNMEMQDFQYTHSSFFKQQPQQGPNETHTMHMAHFNHLHSNNILNQNNPVLMGSHPQPFSDILQQDSLGRFQGLDINGQGTHLIQSEGQSISASESSNTF